IWLQGMPDVLVGGEVARPVSGEAGVRVAVVVETVQRNVGADEFGERKRMLGRPGGDALKCISAAGKDELADGCHERSSAKGDRLARQTMIRERDDRGEPAAAWARFRCAEW